MAQILDARGNPIEKTTLAEPQTAKMASLHQEFAEHPSRGITPQKLYALLANAEQGDLVAQSDLFDDMEERDTHIFAEMSKRKRAMLTLEWRVDPPPDASAQEKQLAEYAEQSLEAMADMEDVFLDALSAIGHGFACLELTWARTSGEYMPAKIEHRPQAWFTLDRATRSQINLRDNSLDGAPLQPFGWIVHQHKSRSGYLARSGLYRALVWPFLFRNYASRDLAEFLEIYGLPLRLGKYPQNATADERRTLLNAVVNIGHAAAGIIPEGMLIEFQEAAKGSHEPHMAMIEWCERSVSKAILGQNVSHDSAQKGSLAGASVDNDVRMDILKSDARQLQGTLTRDLVYPILAINKGLADIRRCPRLVFDVREVEDLALYAESLPKLAGIGMRIPAKWAHEKLAIPEPMGDDQVLEIGATAPVLPDAKPVSARPAPVDGASPAKAALKFTPAAERMAPPQVESALSDSLDIQARHAIEDLISQVRTMVYQADSLEQLREWMLDAYEGTDSTQLAQIMALGIATAHLAGRFDVAREGSNLPVI
jgi:phage gp29-like protein